MRVSTYDRYATAVDSLQRREQQLTQTQEQMTSGKRIARPSDDPSALARAERAFAAQQRETALTRSIDASRSAMSLAESTLGQINEVLQDARETVVSAGNGSFTANERAAQSAQLRNLRSQLMSLANQGDGAGGFVFGGQGSTSAPFIDAAGGVQSVNTPGAMQLSPRETLPTSIDGAALWLAVPSGNGVYVTDRDDANTGSAWIDAGSVTNPSELTGASYALQFTVSAGVTTYSVLRDGLPTALTDVAYTESASIEIDGMAFSVTGTPADGDRYTIEPSVRELSPFDAIDALMAVLDDPAASDNDVTQAVQFGLRDLDAAMGQMQGARAEAGATLKRLDAIEQRGTDRKLWATTVQSDAEDADMVEVISSFQSQQSGYQAALQSYAIVQRMSLFDYLQ